MRPLRDIYWANSAISGGRNLQPAVSMADKCGGVPVDRADFNVRRLRQGEVALFI